MAARRLIMLMLVLLVISSLAAALAPVRRPAEQEPPGSTTPTETPPPQSRSVERTIDAGERKPDTIKLALGDELALIVRARRVDEVEIPALGELEDVDPNAPARFDLLPQDRGRYAVRLVQADRNIGWIEVSPRRSTEDRGQGGDEAAPPSSSDSPGSSTTASTPGARWAS